MLQLVPEFRSIATRSGSSDRETAPDRETEMMTTLNLLRAIEQREPLLQAPQSSSETYCEQSIAC